MPFVVSFFVLCGRCNNPIDANVRILGTESVEVETKLPTKCCGSLGFTASKVETWTEE